MMAYLPPYGISCGVPHNYIFLTSNPLVHYPKRLPQTLGETPSFNPSNYLDETPDYAIARNAAGRVGVKWNRNTSDRPNGFPYTSASGHPQQRWFIHPDSLAKLVVAAADVFEQP